MDQKTDRLQPYAPLEKIDLEQRLKESWMMYAASKTQITTKKNWLYNSKKQTINQKRINNIKHYLQ